MSQKHICDLCQGELWPKADELKEEGGFLGIFHVIKVFRAFPAWRVSRVTVQFPFSGKLDNLDICNKCMTDFTEFVQKKRSYFEGGKK